MPAHADSFTVQTRGKGTYELTAEVARIVRASGVRTGTATVFIRHTSASLVIYENADPSARADLHEFFERLAPEDESYYAHTSEGGDDTTSHLRMVLTRTSETVPVVDGFSPWEPGRVFTSSSTAAPPPADARRFRGGYLKV